MNLFKFESSHHKVAVEDDNGNSLYYHDIERFIEKLEKIINKKKLITVIANNDIETILFYVACIRLKITIIFISNKKTSQNLYELIDQYQPDYIWRKIVKNDEKSLIYYNQYGLFRLKNEPKNEINSKIDLLLSTSGTTGNLKYVKLSSENLLSNASSITKYLNLDANERPIVKLPINYAYGLSVINSHLNVGAKIYLTDENIVKKNFWKIVSNKNITSLAGVPFTFEIIKKMNIGYNYLKNIRYLTQAGGKLNKELVLYFGKLSRKCDFNFYVMYGQTEATARITYLPPEYNLEKPESVGIAIPGGEIEIKNKTKNKYGEIIYKGTNVMLGYANSRIDLESGDQLKGILNTNDIGYLDSDNFLYVSGRKDRKIKILGNRINLDDVEKLLNKEEYGYICIPFGEKIKVVMINNGDKKTISKKLYKEYEIPINFIEYEKVKNFEYNENGKIDYKFYERRELI